MAAQQQQYRPTHTKFIQILQISRNRKVLPPLPHTHNFYTYSEIV